MADLPPGFTLDPMVPQTPPGWLQSSVDGAAPPAVPQAAMLPEGFTLDPGHPTSGPTGNLATDIPRRLGTAAVDAVTGLISPIARADSGTPLMTVKPTGDITANDQAAPTPAQGTANVTRARNSLFDTEGGTEYVPSSFPDRIGQSALTMALTAPIAGVGAASLPAVAARTVGALPAAAGAGAGSQIGAELYPSHPNVGAAIGGLAGAGMASTGANLATGRVTGAPSAGTAELAQSARDTYGIAVTGGQISDSPVVRFINSQLKKVPFSGAAESTADQQTGFNRAVAGTFGETADKITPDVLQAARTRIGGVYNDVAQRTSIPASPELLTDLQGVVDNARLNMSADSVEPVERQAMNIVDTAANNGGVISGRQFKDLTAKGGPIDTIQGSTDSGLRQAGNQFESVLKQHLAANAAPEDVAALQQADTQWKALKTVEPLTLRADTVGGATPSTGDISPAGLRGAVNQSYKNAAVAQPGQLPLNDLANIGQRFLKEPGDSNTATREMVTHGLGAAGGLAAALAGGHEAGLSLPETAAGVGVPIIAGRLAGAYLRSPMYANRLINAGLNPDRLTFSGPGPLARALAPAVAARLATTPNSGTPQQ